MGRPGRRGFDPLGAFSNLAFAVSLGLGFVGWWTAFIGQIVVESKYNGVGSAAGTLWFSM